MTYQDPTNATNIIQTGNLVTIASLSENNEVKWQKDEEEVEEKTRDFEKFAEGEVGRFMAKLKGFTAEVYAHRDLKRKRTEDSVQSPNLLISHHCQSTEKDLEMKEPELLDDTIPDELDQQVCEEMT